MDLVTETVVGAAIGTPLQQIVEKNFRGEKGEVGWYLAASRQAQREGYPEVAEVFKTIAMEEAMHAAQFAEALAEIKTTAENLKQAISGEQESNRSKYDAAQRAKEDGIDELHDVFHSTAKDEARHARALQGLWDRYFGGMKH